MAMPGTEKWQHLQWKLTTSFLALLVKDYVTVAMPGTEKVTTSICKLIMLFLCYLLRIHYRGDAWNWKVTTSIRKLTTSFLCCLLRTTLPWRCLELEKWQHRIWTTHDIIPALLLKDYVTVAMPRNWKVTTSIRKTHDVNHAAAC